MLGVYASCFFHYPLKPANALWNMGRANAAGCLASYGRERVRPSIPAESNETFESWVVGRFGRRLFEMFFKSYSEKLWGIPCDQLDADFAGQRIKKFSLAEAIKAGAWPGQGSAQDARRSIRLSHGRHRHGLRTDGRGVSRNMAAVSRLNTPVRCIIHRDHQVLGLELEHGQIEPFDHVISTMPLTLLVRGLGDLPGDVEDGLRNLRFRNTILVYLNVENAELFKDQWLYIHSPELGMGRVTNFRNWTPRALRRVPTSILALEYWCYDEDPLWAADDAILIALGSREIRADRLDRQREHLRRARRASAAAIRCTRSGYKKHLQPVIEQVRRFSNLQAIGQYGAFKYNNQDHSILMGVLAAENVVADRGHDLWAINTDSEYQESASVAKSGLERVPIATPTHEPVQV